MKKYIAEMIGTMVLVLMGCGSAVFAGGLADTVGAGVGTIGVALAFGLSVVAMAYAIGGISGCHINPAITLGVFLTGRMNGKDAGMYMISQVIGAIIGSAILFALVSTGAHDGPTATGSNGFGDGEMLQAFIAEAVFSFHICIGSARLYRSEEGSRQSGRTCHRFDSCIGTYCMYSYHRDFCKPGT